MNDVIEEINDLLDEDPAAKYLVVLEHAKDVIFELQEMVNELEEQLCNERIHG